MTAPARRSYQIPLPSSVLHLGERCLVMGIVNVSPDSFAGGIAASARAIGAPLRMEHGGADLIDVGGESTRPGADPVSADEELARVLPVVRGLAGRLRVPLSVDTTKAVVAREALAAGAALINDVSGLRRDAALARVAADAGAGLILMHSRGTPEPMNADAEYEDLLDEVGTELQASIACGVAAGVALERIVVDPGVGFAKRPAHSYGVLAGLPALAARLDRPILVGPSRKSFLREALDDRP